ncbi:DUF5005 domain-containing protein [Lentzea sp. BCCO 10_0856]|uniref:DUF5005 domain-containing protein n=1 Tax=Lentzea miocenica TaxID=3095431 RepID=A0ABU4SZT0_9PSEU|nr:DUF5005 domain-containing protein [Lentzea sp. BCCO 10_0856]MDX8031409.1 DUF5005 domain-containing protein [Lentzea sp. BCCO 10_0856]
MIISLVLGIVPSAAAQPDAGCPDVLVLGSRGSGEPQDGVGVGKPVTEFWNQLRSQLPADKSIELWPNPYRAISLIGAVELVQVTVPLLWNKANYGRYRDSVDDGVVRLSAKITEFVAACGTTQLVISGYSQGGQVSAEVYESLAPSVRSRVAGMVLFGEPVFNSASRSALGNFEYGRHGSLQGPRPEFTEPERVLSYCHFQDFVCQGMWDWNRLKKPTQLFGIAPHLNYDTLGNFAGGPTYPESAARTIAGRLRPAPPSAGPTAVITPVDGAVAGEPVGITAAQSVDPQGRKLTYHWDLDNSGQYSTTSPGPAVIATFDTAGQRTVGLRVTNDAGQSAVTSAVIPVVAPDDFTAPPGKPVAVTSTPSPDQTSATLTWQPAPSGPPAETYEVVTTDGQVIAAIEHGGAGQFTLPAAELPISVVVQAKNRAGDSPDSDAVVMSVAGPGKPHGDLNQLWNAYGDQGGHWTGGDRTASVPLPDGRTAWLFSDTFLGTVNPDHSRPANSPMPRNTLVVQNANGSLGTTLHGGTPEAPRALVEQSGSSLIHWVGDGVVEGGSLRVLYNLYESTGPGGLDVRLAGTSLATFSLPGLQLTELRRLSVGATTAWGSEILVEGGHTYIYGSENNNVRVARSANGVGGAWEYWTGSGWSSDELTSTAVLNGVGTAFSVTKVGQEYALVTVDATNTFSSTVMGYAATGLTGPFTRPRVLYQAPEVGSGGKQIIVYDATVHQQYSSGSTLLFSYNVNSLNASDNYADARIYRPRFVSANWTPGAPDPEALPGPPTNLTARDNGDGSATLEWRPVQDTGVVYRVYQRDLRAAQADFTRLSGRYAHPSATIGFLRDQHRYEFRVTAENPAGESAPSNTAELDLHVGRPEPPTALTATPNDAGEVSLHWVRSPSSGLVNYTVLRRDETGGENEFTPIGAPDTSLNTTKDTGLAHQHTYEYKVVASRSGLTSDPSNLAQATARYALPAAPTGLTATSRPDGQIDVAWRQPEAGAWYYVYQRDLTIGQQVPTRLDLPITTCCGFTAGYLTHGHEYEFQVSAVNRGGEGPKSAPATAVSTYPVPQAPTALTATPGNGEVKLRWTASPTPDVFYWIYQRDVTGGETTLRQLPYPLSTCCEFTAGLLANDHEYEFAVSATNQAGESPSAGPVRATPKAPLPERPTGLTATPRPDGTIKLTWQEATPNTWFTVYQRHVDNEPDFTALPLPITTCCEFTAGMLEHNEAYEFKVAATNGTGDSPHSQVARATAFYSPPPAPGNLRGRAAGNGRVSLDWDSAGPSLFYWVYQRNAGSGNFQKSLFPTDRLEASIEPLVHGTAYEFYVTAQNAGGEGPPSATVQVTSLGGLPAPPGALTATAGDGQVSLTWVASTTPGAQYYVWQRDTAAQSWKRLPIPVNCCSFTAGLLANGTTYEFRVTAANASGESTPSTVASARPMPPLPAAASGLSAVAGDGKVTLNWNASPSPSVMYWIEYRAGGNWTRLQYPLSTCCAFTVERLANGTTYQFRVFAANLSGDGAPSNVASARPMPPLPAAASGLSAVAGDGRVTLNWNASPSPSVMYWIEYRAAGGTWTRLRYPLSTCCGFTVTYLGNGTTYEFRVFATNLAGDSAPTNVASARPMPPLPVAPNALSATLEGQTTAKLLWTAVPNAYYYVYLRRGNGAFERLAYPFSTNYATVPMQYGYFYEFYVTAINMTGESGHSPHATVRSGPRDFITQCATAVGSFPNPISGDPSNHYAFPKATICGYRNGSKIDYSLTWTTSGHRLMYGYFRYQIEDCATGNIVSENEMNYPTEPSRTDETRNGVLQIDWRRMYRVHAFGEGNILVGTNPGPYYARFTWGPGYSPRFDAWSSCF